MCSSNRQQTKESKVTLLSSGPPAYIQFWPVKSLLESSLLALSFSQSGPSDHGGGQGTHQSITIINDRFKTLKNLWEQPTFFFCLLISAVHVLFSRFSPDFLLTLSRFLKNSLYPNFILIFEKIWIKSG